MSCRRRTFAIVVSDQSNKRVYSGREKKLQSLVKSNDRAFMREAGPQRHSSSFACGTKLDLDGPARKASGYDDVPGCSDDKFIAASPRREK